MYNTYAMPCFVATHPDLFTAPCTYSPDEPKSDTGVTGYYPCLERYYRSNA